MIMSGSREQLVTAAKHVLPHQIQRHVRVAGFRQVAVRCSADEATLALWIVPACCLAIGNDWSCRCAIALLLLLLLLAAWAALLLSRLALSAASALIASTTPVVSILPLAGMAILIAIAMLLLTTARLRVVLLVLRGVACGARPVCCRRRRRGRI